VGACQEASDDRCSAVAGGTAPAHVDPEEGHPPRARS
jgi:hypothetical protein